MAHTKSSSRESRTQKIVLLLLPVFGVLALRVVTFIRHPFQPTAVRATNTEKVVDRDLAEQNAVVTEMKKHLLEATDAIKAGDFAKAKDHYNEFHNKWTTIEGDFKEKSLTNYQEMEEGMDKVNRNLISAATPDKDATLSGLQLLTRTLDAYTSSVVK